MAEYDYLFKMLLVGDAGVGKSGLLKRFDRDTFTESYIRTIGVDFMIKTVDLDGKKAKLQIWDTAGEKRFRTITNAYYRGAQGVMIVYDVTDRSSFDDVQEWMEETETHGGEDVKKVLVGNKCDLSSQRVVSLEEGKQLAVSLGIPFFETSAKEASEVTEAFMTLARSIFASIAHGGDSAPASLDAQRALLRKYALVALKVSAGMVRLCLEDILNLFVQWAFLVKFWREFQWSMRTFTLTSMAAGLGCAAYGPLKDLHATMKARRMARERGIADQLSVGGDAGDSLGGGPRDEELGKPLIATEEVSVAGRPSTQQAASQAAGHPKSRMPQTAPVYDFSLHKGSVLDFLLDRRARHSTGAHRLLVFCAIAYWGSMAALPFLFGERIGGGVHASVPSSAVLFFTLVTVSSMLAELWIGNHTEQGFHVTTNCWELVSLAVAHRRSKELSTVGAILLSLMGRYDTFSDVIFAVILWKSDPITYLEFDSLNGFTVHFPIPLHYVAVFSLVVGVFCCQGVPGVLLVALKKGLPAAFKLNEFNFLLGLVEYHEATLDEIDAAATAALEDAGGAVKSPP